MPAQALYDRLPVFLQDAAVTVAGWRRRHQRYNRRFRQTLVAWEGFAQQPLATRRMQQAERLVAMQRHARTQVPHYRDLGGTASRMRETAEETIHACLSALPVLEKETVRSAPERFRAENQGRRDLIRGHTSGTTGTALPIWYTRQAAVEEWVTVWRHRRSLGIDVAARHATFAGNLVVPFGQVDPPFWRQNYALHQTLYSVHHIGARFLPSIVEHLLTAGFRYVVGYPSALERVAGWMIENDRRVPSGALAAVFLSSETASPTTRAVIQDAFQAPVRARYGSAEFAVSMVECAAGGLHVDPEFGIVEVEVRESGAGWERGDLLVTGFANEGMPFIRYRIGDVGTRSLVQCPCGTPGDVFLAIDGRIEDAVSTPDGREVGRLDHIFKDRTDIRRAQIHQPTRNRLEVRVVVAPGWDEPSGRERVVRSLQERVGSEMDIDVYVVEDIEIGRSGKFRAVTSGVARESG